MLIDGSLTRPNGIALSPDERLLYISVSDEKAPRILAYPLDAHGLPRGDPRVLLDARPTDAGGAPGLPDGMKVAADGTLFCSAPGGMLVLSPEGEPLGLIADGQAIANCVSGKTADAVHDIVGSRASDAAAHQRLARLNHQAMPPARTGFQWENGAQGRDRTADTAIFSRMLYQLSYLGACTDGHRRRKARFNRAVSVAVQPALRVGIGRRRRARDIPRQAIAAGRGPAAAAAERREVRRRSACRKSGRWSDFAMIKLLANEVGDAGAPREARRPFGPRANQRELRAAEPVIGRRHRRRRSLDPAQQRARSDARRDRRGAVRAAKTRRGGGRSAGSRSRSSRCARTAAAAPRRSPRRPPAARPCLRSSGKSMPIDPPMPWRTIARAAAVAAGDRERLERRLAVDVEQRHRRGRRHAAARRRQRRSRRSRLLRAPRTSRPLRDASGWCARRRRTGAPLAVIRASRSGAGASCGAVGRGHGAWRSLARPGSGIASRTISTSSAAPCVMPAGSGCSNASPPPPARRRLRGP